MKLVVPDADSRFQAKVDALREFRNTYGHYPS